MKPTSDSAVRARPHAVAAGPASPRARLLLRLSVSLDHPDAVARVPAAAFDLLRRLPRVDSLREAASGCGLSYRHAWALVRSAEAALGASLIETRRGRGSVLTPYGALLAAALEEIESRLAPELDAATQALSAALSLGAGRHPVPPAPCKSGAGHAAPQTGTQP
jgi:molybdate transport repressor ModE-like protein